ncbi:MAG: hypothetical protein K0Q95_1099 [Bacteroidota bacterium]|jgi:hypothetical protein|nr:hypothetical protein [Bacteroidota bacterium]
MIRRITLFILLVSLHTISFAQKKSKKEPEEKKTIETAEAEKMILEELNKIRTAAGLDIFETNEILSRASSIQAEDMAKNGKASLENSSGKYKTTAKRVVAVGGTKNAEETVLSVSALKGKAAASPKDIADAVIAKWKIGKKELVIIKNGSYVFASPSVKLDATGKKAFISVVYGGFNIVNDGAKKKKELKMPYTAKNKKIKPADVRACKNCEKFKDYDGLQKGLYVKDNKVYLKYANLKNFSKLIKKPADGLAIDFVQKAQYSNPSYNIYDNNLLSKGVLQKTVTKDKIYSKNLVKPEKKGKKVSKLDVQLATIPKGLAGEYEMNLLVIQDGKLCKTIRKSYIEQGDQESSSPLNMLLMPEDAAYTKPPFEPKSESTLLNFSIPFEKNKSDYKEADLVPFLNALQEPDFFIEGMYITAYSSIEGDASSNATLQKKRAESIIKALSKMQKSGVVTNVKTSDSWSLFQMEAEDGKYDYLTKMTKEKAIQEINSKGLAPELEPILAKERFAQIVMDVTYDIAGAKEEKFSVSKFNQAVKKGDIKQAYKIQYYIGKQIQNQKYTAEAQVNMSIPAEAKYSGLLNNQIVNNYMINNNVVDDEDYVAMKKLATVDPANNYIKFNNLFCAVKLDSTIGDKKAQDDMQAKIEGLYKSEIPKKYVDALNTEWQFRIIEVYDTLESGQQVVETCINRIKSFYNFKDGSWQNALKLSYIFARFKDYKFAAKILEPFVKEGKPDEKLLFAYASFCAQEPELINSRMFVTGLKKAEQVNHDRYCKLFGQPFLTFQILDNPLVKQDYNKAGCK